MNKKVIDYILSMNVIRRHLSSSQKAAIAAEILPIYKNEARQRMLATQNNAKGRRIADTGKSAGQSTGEAAEVVARLLGTNKKYVQIAQEVKTDDPVTFGKIKNGNINISKVKKQRELKSRNLKIIAQDAKNPIKPVVTLASFEEWLPKQSPCDLLLTDPPYSTDVPDIEKFSRRWLPMALAKVKPTGRAYVFVGHYPKELRAYLNIAPPEHMRLEDILSWTYLNTMGTAPIYGYKRNVQAILYYIGKDAPPLNCSLLTEHSSSHVIAMPVYKYHTWEKPNYFGEIFTRHSTKSGDIVFDPFTGTGTFVLAASRLGRKAFGCDVDPKMLKIAQKRGCELILK